MRWRIRQVARNMIEDIEIDLPLPPSVNAIWRPGSYQFYQSRRYQRWVKEADALLYAQQKWRNKKLPGRFTCLLILNEDMMRSNMDGDNKLKVPLDYAKRLGLIVDDSIKYCRQWIIKLGDVESAPTGARLILRACE